MRVEKDAVGPFPEFTDDFKSREGWARIIAGLYINHSNRPPASVEMQLVYTR